MNEYDVRSIFEEMELELIASMKRNLSRHQQWENAEGINWTMWQAEQLKTFDQFKKHNENIFSKKFSRVNKEIEELLEQTYERSGMEQEQAILEELLGKDKQSKYKSNKGLEGAFFRLNEDKMNALIKATTNDLQKAEYAMLRMVNDQYRKTIFKSQVMANSGAFTLKQSIDQATKDFLKAGINCIQYKDGRRVNIASYAEMAIRTSNKRAVLTSEGDVRRSYGVHTVRISTYGQCSETCLPWQGRVYVDDVFSGGTKEEAKQKKLPLLSEAIAGGLFHPNCRHRATTYFYDIKKDLGKLEEDGVEVPIEEQEHRKNNLHIQQQKRLEVGSLDTTNTKQAKIRKEQWIKLDEQDNVDLNYVKQEMLSQLQYLTDDEKSVLTKYTGNFAYNLNYLLNNGGYEKFSNEISILDEVLNKGEITKNIILRRKSDIVFLLGKPHYNIDDVMSLIGTKRVEKGYTSTSFEEFKNINLLGRNAYIEFKVRKGFVGALYIKKLAYDNVKHQEEVLLKRNLCYIINSIKEVDGIFYLTAEVLEND